MLALKLAIVPAFVLLLSLATDRWGPRVAGWLAGLPIVVGPILLLIAFEHGPEFAAHAATSALAAVAATVAFIVAYSHAAARAGWPVALAVGFGAWLLAVAAVSLVPESTLASLALAAAALAAAPRLLPRPVVLPPVPQRADGHAVRRVELASRMLAGAVLTVAATAAADVVGPRWGGTLAVFPVLASVLAVFSHRAEGAAFVAQLLRAMSAGMSSLVAFCLVVALALPALGIATGFAVGIAGMVLVQAATRRVAA